MFFIFFKGSFRISVALNFLRVLGLAPVRYFFLLCAFGVLFIAM